MSFLMKNFRTLNNVIRTFSQGPNAFRLLSFKEAKSEIESQKAVVLDVREQAELTHDGKLAAGVLNVPVGEVPKAFVMANDEFERKYGAPKPQTTEDILIHCKKGVRAELAAKVLSQLGYSNVRVYSGIEDWKANGGQLVK